MNYEFNLFRTYTDINGVMFTNIANASVVDRLYGLINNLHVDKSKRESANVVINFSVSRMEGKYTTNMTTQLVGNLNDINKRISSYLEENKIEYSDILNITCYIEE